MKPQAMTTDQRLLLALVVLVLGAVLWAVLAPVDQIVRAEGRIIAAGRADLCAVARPHLANPAWILTEGAKSGYADVPWPKQYVAAKIQLERNLEREKQQAAAAKNAMSFEQITQIFGEV
jgi:2,4-dienoyl-CoA reductase-like NADH-dependent reductase (Old Yellow Enzyme family)